MGWLLLTLYTVLVVGALAFLLWRDRKKKKEWVSRHPWLRPLATIPPKGAGENVRMLDSARIVKELRESAQQTKVKK